MSDIKLTDYLPSIDAIPVETLKEARDRIHTYLSTEFEDVVDMSPNSVFGDLILNPFSHLVAAFEMSANRIFSDIDLANISEGVVYNCDFVKKYLENFGLSQRLEFPSTGVVRLTFNQPGSYILDARSALIFSLDNINHVFEMTGITDFLEVTSSLGEEPETTSKRKLIKVSENEYVVNVPCAGPAGIAILKNSEAASDLSMANLLEIRSVVDFDPGVLPENVMELANKAQKTYYASSLTTRTGALSFLLQTFPELQGVSPVLSGDVEMSRGTSNILGIAEGVMDIHIKSRKTFVTEFLTQRFAYNNSEGHWHGKIKTNSGPPAYIHNIKRTNGDSVTYNLYGKASDLDKYPKLSAAYSKEESLGLTVNAPSRSSDIDASINFEQVSDPSRYNIEIIGEYEGYVFSDKVKRVLNLTINSYNPITDVLSANLIDIDDNENIGIEFEATDSNKYQVIITDEYYKFLKGINITIDFLLGTPTQDQAESIIDKVETFTVTAKNTEFTIEYEYDPNLLNIDTIVNNSDVRPVNSDILIRNFLTCHVNKILITYRSKLGKYVDTEHARGEIAAYVNSLSYPNLYEEHSVAEIMLYYGADGVRSVAQEGQFMRSQADKYLVNCFDSNDADIDEYGDCYEDVLNPTTHTLLPSDNLVGLGERNIHYILKSDNIIFNEISF